MRIFNFLHLDKSNNYLKKRLFIKHVFKVLIFNKVVRSKEVPNGRQVLNFCFVDEIKNLYTNKAYEKSCLVVKTNNKKDKNIELTMLPII